MSPPPVAPILPRSKTGPSRQRATATAKGVTPLAFRGRHANARNRGRATSPEAIEDEGRLSDDPSPPSSNRRRRRSFRRARADRPSSGRRRFGRRLSFAPACRTDASAHLKARRVERHPDRALHRPRRCVRGERQHGRAPDRRAFAGFRSTTRWSRSTDRKRRSWTARRADFVAAIDSVGLVQQARPRRYLKILKPVRVERGRRLRRVAPADRGFRLDVEIDFDVARDRPPAARLRRSIRRRSAARSRAPAPSVSSPTSRSCGRRASRSARRSKIRSRIDGDDDPQSRRPALRRRVRAPQGARRGRRLVARRRADRRRLPRLASRPQAQRAGADGAVRRPLGLRDRRGGGAPSRSSRARRRGACAAPPPLSPRPSDLPGAFAAARAVGRRAATFCSHCTNCASAAESGARVGTQLDTRCAARRRAGRRTHREPTDRCNSSPHVWSKSNWASDFLGRRRAVVATCRGRGGADCRSRSAAPAARCSTVQSVRRAKNTRWRSCRTCRRARPTIRASTKLANGAPKEAAKKFTDLGKQYPGVRLGAQRPADDDLRQLPGRRVRPTPKRRPSATQGLSQVARRGLRRLSRRRTPITSRSPTSRATRTSPTRRWRRSRRS